MLSTRERRVKAAIRVIFREISLFFPSLSQNLSTIILFQEPNELEVTPAGNYSAVSANRLRAAHISLLKEPSHRSKMHHSLFFPLARLIDNSSGEKLQQ